MINTLCWLNLLYHSTNKFNLWNPTSSAHCLYQHEPSRYNGTCHGENATKSWKMIRICHVKQKWTTETPIRAKHDWIEQQNGKISDVSLPKKNIASILSFDAKDESQSPFSEHNFDRCTMRVDHEANNSEKQPFLITSVRVLVIFADFVLWWACRPLPFSGCRLQRKDIVQHRGIFFCPSSYFVSYCLPHVCAHLISFPSP